MGGRGSKRASFSLYGSSSFNQQPHPQSEYPQQNPNYTPPRHHHAPAPSNHGAQTSHPQGNLDRRYLRIADNYQKLEQVTDALAHAGLESSKLIVGIDFTKSNECTGSRSFNRRSLHHIGNDPNPYEQAISIIGRTLSAFDEDNLIPCFGFGDDSTRDQGVFGFYPDTRFCNGYEEVLRRYREIVPHLRLSGPTSFAPIIEMATRIVEESGGQYHVLLIVADGQVTRSADTPRGRLGPQEQNTIDAIMKASKYPLSIILVGVGDGPWDTMREFNDNIPARAFDNFQFVNFTDIMSKNVDSLRKQTEFALSALMEIPSQYKATLELNISGRRTGDAPTRVPLPPPLHDAASLTNASKPYQYSSSFQQSTPYYSGYDTPTDGAPSSSSVFGDNLVCINCHTNLKSMALFICGHYTCCDCENELVSCPTCLAPIEYGIKLF
ncbi:E3 ubiquitin-protein ligase RGLG2-like [Actinidia eriantha]|uniref:E3 ubiquitin-protein ligase RGLG2-like n=1 Tax=Actinidia eriantha TaxID=165200 RepID=UPI0025879427|nr:E3 ubiquitin-protein ligase RGLG2-like [Actinidia eriantha]XP_057486364.1 E3 ubiquitin-protein ligase RGLG2-like [Actinidia eriantha]